MSHCVFDIQGMVKLESLAWTTFFRQQIVFTNKCNTNALMVRIAAYKKHKHT